MHIHLKHLQILPIIIEWFDGVCLGFILAHSLFLGAAQSTVHVIEILDAHFLCKMMFFCVVGCTFASFIFPFFCERPEVGNLTFFVFRQNHILIDCRHRSTMPTACSFHFWCIGLLRLVLSRNVWFESDYLLHLGSLNVKQVERQFKQICNMQVELYPEKGFMMHVARMKQWRFTMWHWVSVTISPEPGVTTCMGTCRSASVGIWPV